MHLPTPSYFLLTIVTCISNRCLLPGSSVMLYSSQDERKLVMLENSLNFRFKKIGTPGAKEIAEASAVIATKK